ncbi:hypothetical protein RSOLAG22IIIB_13910 [Rhizoctonia solani]|uniref:Uncharacterized protein n=1 Tax=Rhizoctonia solani TaxID=456999 RepID=A0A0K6FRY8_9AGAM|nr:hypothetical protein RSOLAG22IIIB_13910 [Rhizoctonia solani]
MARVSAQVVEAPPKKPSARCLLCWPLQWFESTTRLAAQPTPLASVPADTAMTSTYNRGYLRLRVLEGLHQEVPATGIERR